MVNLRVVGVAPGGETIDVTAALSGVPRVGDCLAVWTGREETYVEVEMVTWPTWPNFRDSDESGPPDVYLKRPDDLSDEEWFDVFEAIKEQRQP